LPIHTDAAQEIAVTDPLIDPSTYGSQVLVVEDEESIRRFLTAGLESLGYRLQTALTAEEALDVLKSQQFDVILTDLGLPGMSGAELARTVQQRAPGTPVVLLTGWGEQLQAENRQIEGVVEILAKPVTIKKLATTLASICAI
jgi:CheY-like chemotaxis protein